MTVLIERRCYDAANKDPLLALLLCLRAIWRGELVADRRGVRLAETDRIAA